MRAAQLIVFPADRQRALQPRGASPVGPVGRGGGGGTVVVAAAVVVVGAAVVVVGTAVVVVGAAVVVVGGGDVVVGAGVEVVGDVVVGGLVVVAVVAVVVVSTLQPVSASLQREQTGHCSTALPYASTHAPTPCFAAARLWMRSAQVKTLPSMKHSILQPSEQPTPRSRQHHSFWEVGHVATSGELQLNGKRVVVVATSHFMP
eukprot:SRR837773.7274.p3 GENE.SRR837773.7274~~SRR837773.7274.p3  ORF type:complete len:203 (-),score=53.49 SRR837773.7274:70-678(-)